MKKILVLAIMVVFMGTGCGKKDDVGATLVVAQDGPERAGTSPAPTATINPAQTGVLRGKILFEGTPPEAADTSVRGNPECAVLHPEGKIPAEALLIKNGRIKNVFVYIKEGLENYKFDAPSFSAEIDNVGCKYVPRVSGAQVGQPIIFLNSDPTLHNIHAFPTVNKDWNIGLPFKSSKQTKRFDAPEVMVTLKCDVHPWMRGYVGILPHPYYVVTGEEGNFELKNVPAGKFVMEVWHEKLGVQSQTIEIKPQETKEIEFIFKS